MNIKDRLAALRRPQQQKAAPKAHKVIVQKKVVKPPTRTVGCVGHVAKPSILVMPENPKHKRIATTPFPPASAVEVAEEQFKEAVLTKNAECDVRIVREVLPLLRPTMENAIVLAAQAGIAYTSLFTTRMGISYLEAVALMDMLEAAGVVAPDEGLVHACCSYRRVYGVKPEVRDAACEAAMKEARI